MNEHGSTKVDSNDFPRLMPSSIWAQRFHSMAAFSLKSSIVSLLCGWNRPSTLQVGRFLSSMEMDMLRRMAGVTHPDYTSNLNPGEFWHRNQRQGSNNTRTTIRPRSTRRRRHCLQIGLDLDVLGSGLNALEITIAQDTTHRYEVSRNLPRSRHEEGGAHKCYFFHSPGWIFFAYVSILFLPHILLENTYLATSRQHVVSKGLNVVLPHQTPRLTCVFDSSQLVTS